MKKYQILLFLLTSLLEAQIVTIPDNNFKNALLNTNCADLDNNFSFESNVDTNNDGEIQLSEAQAVFKLRLNDLNITDLEGIQNFTNITDLRCENNLLTTLDLSSNINLELVLCNENQLVNLDVSQCQNLNRLHCNDNQLTALDFTPNLILYALNCDNNDLMSLNVKNGNNTNLFQMWADENPNLPCISVDDVDYSNGLSNWIKEDNTEYSEDCASLSIEDYEYPSISLVQSFDNDLLIIKCISSQIGIVKIFSIDGTLINNYVQSTINISSFSKGIYLALITTNDGKRTIKKFFKN